MCYVWPESSNARVSSSASTVLSCSMTEQIFVSRKAQKKLKLRIKRSINKLKLGMKQKKSQFTII